MLLPLKCEPKERAPGQQPAVRSCSSASRNSICNDSRLLALSGGECGLCRLRRHSPHSPPNPCELPEAVRSLEEKRPEELPLFLEQAISDNARAVCCSFTSEKCS